MKRSFRQFAAKIANSGLVAATLTLAAGGATVDQAQAADAPCGTVSCCHKINDYFQLKKQEIKFGEPLPTKATCNSPVGTFLSGLRFLEHLFDTFPETTKDLKPSLASLSEYTVYFGQIKSWASTNPVFKTIFIAEDINSIKSNAAIAEIIAHELVHAHWRVRHVECIKGEWKGSRSCDERLFDRFLADKPLSYTASYSVLDLARKALPESEKSEYAAIDEKMWELRQVINYPQNWLK